MAENSHSQNEQGKTQNKYSPSSKQKRLVIALWERMTQLFGHKWESREGPSASEGYLSHSFLLWCRKTEGLTDDMWRRGFDTLEYRVREAGRYGDEIWPPSYAEFVGYCEPPAGYAAHKKFPVGLPEPKSVREKRYEIGRQKCGDLLRNLFPEEEEIQNAS